MIENAEIDVQLKCVGLEAITVASNALAVRIGYRTHRNFRSGKEQTVQSSPYIIEQSAKYSYDPEGAHYTSKHVSFGHLL